MISICPFWFGKFDDKIIAYYQIFPKKSVNHFSYEWPIYDYFDDNKYDNFRLLLWPFIIIAKFNSVVE